MSCIDRQELERFLKGELAQERLIAVDSHVRGCDGCRMALCNLPGRKQTGADLCLSLLGVGDCPEYEELSAFVDNVLEPDAARDIQIHANMCEYCTSDIAAMRESRSHASLVDRVTVTPGASRARPANPLVFWKRALVGASVAAVAVAVALTIGPGSTPQTPTNIATGPGRTQVQKPQAPNTVTVPQPGKPDTIAQKPNKPAPNAPSTPAPPAYTVALRDGKYQVVKKDGRLVLAKANGESVAGSLGSKLAASIDEKLRTGKTSIVGSVSLAVTAGRLRSETDYTPPPSAPKLVAPLGKVILSNKPSFAWLPVEMADSYRLRITDEHGNVVAEQIVGGTAITLSKPLRRGEVYAWRVGSKFAESESWAESAVGKFQVLSADDYASIQRVKQTLPGSHLALGAAYERLGLKDEAAREYRLLRRQNPNSELAKELLHKSLK